MEEDSTSTECFTNYLVQPDKNDLDFIKKHNCSLNLPTVELDNIHLI